MKIIWAILTAGSIFCFSSARAQQSPVALGVRISSNAPIINHSVSMRYYINVNHAVEGLVSFDPVALGALYEVFQPTGAEGLSWFYGGGAYTSFEKPITAGLQGILGLDYNFPNLPINLSLDWKPELNLTRSVNFEPAAVGISARFIIPGK